jgi:hypothetical protein
MFMTILDPLLRDALRTLKLAGMLETLDARLAPTVLLTGGSFFSRRG